MLVSGVSNATTISMTGSRNRNFHQQNKKLSELSLSSMQLDKMVYSQNLHTSKINESEGC